MKKKVLVGFSTLFLTLPLAGCGYDGHYRYPCQDPANWENAECKPPICEASGTCLEDLLGYDPFAPESDTIEEEQNTEESSTSEVVEDETSEVVEEVGNE